MGNVSIIDHTLLRNCVSIVKINIVLVVSGSGGFFWCIQQNSSTLLTPKQQSLRYPGQQPQPGYGPNSPQPPQLPPQLSGAPVPGPGIGGPGSGGGGGGGGSGGGSSGGAKWHIPQNMQAQQNNGECSVSL